VLSSLGKPDQSLSKGIFFHDFNNLANQSYALLKPKSNLFYKSLTCNVRSLLINSDFDNAIKGRYYKKILIFKILSAKGKDKGVEDQNSV